MTRKKICLVFLVQKTFDTAAVFERAFQDSGVDVEVVRIPTFWMSELTPRRVIELQRLLKEKSKTRSVIFSPDSTELFLKSEYMVLFSAYRSWFRAEAMRVIPHIWTPVSIAQNVDHLRWRDKPPPRIGFMGRSHSTSRATRLALKSPRSVKEWCLRAPFLKYPLLVALMNVLGFSLANINAFARIETLAALTANRHAYADLELELIEKKELKASAVEKEEYREHLLRSTYVVCPRGTENYSFRIYEALNYGRIPVIIDTDVVLPDVIDWRRLAVIVPYRRLEQTYDFIRDDYQSRSAEDFFKRQEAAFSTMAGLQTMDWVKDFARDFSRRD